MEEFLTQVSFVANLHFGLGAFLGIWLFAPQYLMKRGERDFVKSFATGLAMGIVGWAGACILKFFLTELHIM